jgi:hypothetical protein
MLRAARAHLHHQVGDAALRDKLRPTIPSGCKRIICSNDFFPALAWPKVEPVTEPIERLTEAGVVTTDGGEHALDAPVCATGFDTALPLKSVVIGNGAGLTLAEALGRGAPGLPRRQRRPVFGPVRSAWAEHRHRPHLDAAVCRAGGRACCRLHAKTSAARRRAARGARGGDARPSRRIAAAPARPVWSQYQNW